MKKIGRCIFLLFLIKNFAEVRLDVLDSTAPALVKKLTANCGKDGIKVVVKFYNPFTGVVYSDGHYDTPKCIFINQQPNETTTTNRSGRETRFSFLIPADECGTVFHDPGSSLATLYGNNNGAVLPTSDVSGNEVYMENTVMFQKNHFIQEQGDLAQTLRCVWQKEIRRPLQATLPLMAKHRRHKHPVEKDNKTIVTSWNWNRTRRPSPSPYVPFPHHYHHNNPHQNQHQQQHQEDNGPGSKKRFKPKGHVESISFGRRNGKSLDVENFSESALLEDLNTLRSLYNLTALPFKADDKSSSGASTVYSIPMINYAILSNCAVFYMISHFIFT